jgi:GTP-binding protein
MSTEVCIKKKDISILDTPSLIKKSFFKKGLGFSFLKHILKSEVVFYMIDISYNSLFEILNDINSLELELFKFNKRLFFKKRYLVFNKMDKYQEKQTILLLKNLITVIDKEKYEKAYFISSKSPIGLNIVSNLSNIIYK